MNKINGVTIKRVAVVRHRERDEDEGIPSETEDDKRQLEIKAKEMRGEQMTPECPPDASLVSTVVNSPPSLSFIPPSDLLKQKDSQIMSLLEEKVRLFRGMCEGSSPIEEACRQTRHFFRSPVGPEPPMGACIMKDALQEGKRGRLKRCR